MRKRTDRFATLLAIAVAFWLSPAVSILVLATDKPASQNSSRQIDANSQSVTVEKPILDSAGAKPQLAVEKKERNPRVLFITAKGSPECDKELARLRRAGGDFEKMRAAGWTIGEGPENLVQIIDCDDVPDVIEKLNLKEFPTVASIDKGEVVRYFRSGCTTPLDMWTFGFLAKGIDERPPGMVTEAARVETTGSYPLRGNHWSVEGDWNPTREKTIAHLHGPNHQSELIPAWHIESWSLEELRSLHDDLHEKYDTGSYSGSSSSSGSGASYQHVKGRS